MVVRSPVSGVEMSAHTPSATRSRLPKGSRATTVPNGDAAQARRKALGITDAASARWAAQLAEVERNSRRDRSVTRFLALRERMILEYG
jgi:hypothetical protein